MQAAESAQLWNADAVITAAKDLIHTSNYEKVPEARETVDSTVAAWVRVATSDPSVHSHAEAAITRLWSLYAALEIELRQFKQATKVFESGVGCPIASRVPTVWLQYADFCIERKKLSNARKVFVRAAHAIANVDNTELWARFLAFVNEHLDPAMSLDGLRAQVVPEGTIPTAPSTHAPPEPAHPPTTATIPTLAPVLSEQPASSPVKETTVPALVASVVNSVVDPTLAFVDTKGDAEPVSAVSVTGVKRKATETPTMSPVKISRTEPHDEDIKAMLEIPTTLPITPGCPHLLFDQIETKREIDNELVDKLSTVLSDNAVFQGVKDLYENQRNRDRDMLYRWQDLVGMQMKEGSELFARHMDIEKSITEPASLIEVKTKHLDQQREFTSRCQMSQQQFIEICEMDRVGALKAQQISLENMKIPEMCVTSDPDAIDIQRAIVGLILETEKLSRQEKAKKAPAAARPIPRKPFAGPSGKIPATTRPRVDSRDHDFGRSSGRGRGGASYGRGRGSFGRGGGNRRPSSPPRGGRGTPKRHDHYDSRQAPPSRTYDEPPARQVAYTYQGDSRSRSHGAAPHAPMNYGDFQRRDRYERGPERRPMHLHPGPPPQEFSAPPRRFGEGPGGRGGPVSDPRYASQETFRGASPHVGGLIGAGAPGAYPHGYDRVAQYSAPQQPPLYASGPPSYGGEPIGLPQQYSVPPPTSYDYPPPNSTVAYGYDNQPPQQSHPQLAQYGHPAHQQPPPRQQQQHHHQQPLVPQQQRGYGAPAPYHPPPLQHQPPPQALHRQPYHGSPPRGGGTGGRGFRRGGGGGGGRYGRR